MENTQGTKIYLVKELLQTEGPTSSAFVFATLEGARHFLEHSKNYFEEWCKSQKMKIEIELDFSENLLYIIQTNKKRKPFSFYAVIEETKIL